MNFSSLLFPDAKTHDEIYKLLYKRYQKLFYWQIINRFQSYDHLNETDFIQLFCVARNKLQSVDDLFPADEFTSIKKAEISFRHYLRYLIGKEMDHYISTCSKTGHQTIRESLTDLPYWTERAMTRKQTDDWLKSLVPQVDYECYQLVHHFHMSKQEIADFLHIPVSLVHARLNHVIQTLACVWMHDFQNKEQL